MKEIVKENYYSNCLYEALKAKIKNRKVHIYVMWDFKTSIFPHFWWEEYGAAYSFVSDKTRRWQILLFKGHLEKRNFRIFKMYSNAQNYEVKQKIKNLFKKESNNIDIELD